MQNEFNWVITNAGLAGLSLTNTAPYPIIGSTTNSYTVNLTNMVGFVPAYIGVNWDTAFKNPAHLYIGYLPQEHKYKRLLMQQLRELIQWLLLQEALRPQISGPL